MKVIKYGCYFPWTCFLSRWLHFKLIVTYIFITQFTSGIPNVGNIKRPCSPLISDTKTVIFLNFNGKTKIFYSIIFLYRFIDERQKYPIKNFIYQIMLKNLQSEFWWRLFPRIMSQRFLLIKMRQWVLEIDIESNQGRRAAHKLAISEPWHFLFRGLQLRAFKFTRKHYINLVNVMKWNWLPLHSHHLNISSKIASFFH